MSTAYDRAISKPDGYVQREHSALTTIGVIVALLSLVVPFLAFAGLVIAAVLLIRGKIGPGFGVGLLSILCGFSGLVVALVLLSA
jgi:hypothetical protein